MAENSFVVVWFTLDERFQKLRFSEGFDAHAVGSSDSSFFQLSGICALG